MQQGGGKNSPLNSEIVAKIVVSAVKPKTNLQRY